MRLCFLLCVIALSDSAPTDERIIIPFTSKPATPDVVVIPNDLVSASADAATDAAVASASASVDASPVIVTKGSKGKKLQISITKEVDKHHEVQKGKVTAHASASASARNDVPVVVEKPSHHIVVPAPAALHIDNNAIVVDNQTMSDVLQKLLAGNIQNIDTHGHPLALPASGKPVAVIYSAAMHVVDLGTLKPALVAPKHKPHNHTAEHAAAINHTSSMLQSLLAPLMSLTHIGAPDAVLPGAVAVPVSAAPASPAVQPLVVMLPIQQGAFDASHIDAAAQLNAALQNLLHTKQQILTAPQPAVVLDDDVSANTILAPKPSKAKTIDINISKTKSESFA